MKLRGVCWKNIEVSSEVNGCNSDYSAPASFARDLEAGHQMIVTMALPMRKIQNRKPVTSIRLFPLINTLDSNHCPSINEINAYHTHTHTQTRSRVY